jgi:pyruvate kinase
VLEFTVRHAKKTQKNSVEVNYDNFTNDVSVGDTVLVDNGLIKLTVIEKKRDRVLCKVITPAALGSRRHINLPGVHVSLPALTEKDIADVALGAQLGVDFVALSFVRKPEDLVELRDLLTSKKSNAQVLAKIEDQAAVESIDDIIKIADLVMVARGDLGIEVPMEELPIIQRRIVKSCIRLGKPVIVATHLLESMIKNRVPTRAEITDVANAVFEQADAIMLSGETTIGLYPVECVEVLNRVATRIERSGGAGYAESAILEDARQKTVAAAVVLANSLARAKIIVFTRHGRMARNTSNLRPERAVIFAFTPSEEVRRQLSICWGVCPARIEFSDDPNVTIETAQKYLRDQKLATAGDNLVIMSDVRARDALVDCVQLRPAK